MISHGCSNANKTLTKSCTQKEYYVVNESLKQACDILCFTFSNNWSFNYYYLHIYIRSVLNWLVCA